MDDRDVQGRAIQRARDQMADQCRHLSVARRLLEEAKEWAALARERSIVLADRNEQLRTLAEPDDPC